MKFLIVSIVWLGPAVALSLDGLARDVSRVEAIREVKDVTATFAQLAQFGRYTDMASLFADDGVLSWGNSSSKGPAAIEKWLRRDAGDMDGIRPGSLDTLVAATPLINLAADGRTSKGRFSGWRFQGDGKEKTRMQGGIYENEYSLVGGQWKISLLKFYTLYDGNYVDGWRNIGRQDFGTVPPFHFTPDEAGIPIPLPPTGEAPRTNATTEQLQRRIEALNDEDEVRNLQHAYGYYVDRRMWTDVTDLFGNGTWDGTFTVDNVGSFSGSHGVRQALEQWMGPEGLTQGILNEHLIFDTVISIRDSGSTSGSKKERLADVRGIEVVLTGNAAASMASWQFGFFQNTFLKRNGIWRILNVTIAPLVIANYSSGWGNGSLVPKSSVEPRFLPHVRNYTSSGATIDRDNSSLSESEGSELQRRLRRSAAYDGTENVSNAYGFYIDFIDGAGCTKMAAIHHDLGHKESPFAGFYQTRQRVLAACTAFYGTTELKTRSGISFHWRPQPVIHVSSDGRSSSLRARLLQPATDKTTAGVLRGGMYQDQMVLDASGIWRLWSVTIDEFYWGISNWKDGWSGVKPRAANASNPAPRDLIKQYPPDLLLTEMSAPRETGFMGGSGRYVAWPEIQRMWFAYRNPVSGRIPNTPTDSYWPGCVPCRDRLGWNLTNHGWLEPPTGPE